MAITKKALENQDKIFKGVKCAPAGEKMKINLEINGNQLSATLADNSSAEALAEHLCEGSITIDMSDYAKMEKVGPLGFDLPTNNEPIRTNAGDIILYQGNNLVIYYDHTSWNFTRLGHIE